MESLASLLGALGLGGAVGAIGAVYLAGRRFAAELGELATVLDETLRDPRRTDLRKLLEEVRSVAAELRTFLGALKRVVRFRR